MKTLFVHFLDASNKTFEKTLNLVLKLVLSMKNPLTLVYYEKKKHSVNTNKALVFILNLNNL